MHKEKYEHTELEIIKFHTEDVITTSANPEDKIHVDHGSGGSVPIDF